MELHAEIDEIAVAVIIPIARPGRALFRPDTERQDPEGICLYKVLHVGISELAQSRGPAGMIRITSAPPRTVPPGQAAGTRCEEAASHIHRPVGRAGSLHAAQSRILRKPDIQPGGSPYSLQACGTVPLRSLETYGCRPARPMRVRSWSSLARSPHSFWCTHTRNSSWRHEDNGWHNPDDSCHRVE